MTRPEQDPAARRVIGGYLAELGGQLGRPLAAQAAIVAELEDGLWTATLAHHARGLPSEEAATAAVAEFGDPRTMAAGFGPELAAATGRRVGLTLLSTGPLVGSSWLLLTAATWGWGGQQPPVALRLVATLVGLALVVAVPAAVLSVATAGRLSRWLPISPRVAATAAAVAASACVAGDLALLGGLLAAALFAGGLSWPAAVLAAGASSTRLSLAGRAARRCLAARATLTSS